MIERQTTALTQDELTLHLIATGVIALSQQLARGEAAYPYPAPLQRGLDRLTLAALRNGVGVPQGVPDLLERCREPLITWPLSLPANALDSADTLLIGDQPSSICDSWACANPDVEAELTEQRLMERVFESCRATNDTNGYVAFRTLIITQPVVTALELQQHCIRSELLRLTEPLRDAYQPIPAGWAVGGEYLCCKRCGNLLLPLATDGIVCITNRCQRKPLVIGRHIPTHEAPLWLLRGLRRFVAEPGQTELRIAMHLERLGIHVERWPALDRYDLRLTFPNGAVWAIDVKDWANPFLLAHQVKPFSRDPVWDLAFFVFPNERIIQRSDYLRAFQQTCTVLTTTTNAVIEGNLVQMAQQEIGRNNL